MQTGEFRQIVESGLARHKDLSTATLLQPGQQLELQDSHIPSNRAGRFTLSFSIETSETVQIAGEDVVYGLKINSEVDTLCKSGSRTWTVLPDWRTAQTQQLVSLYLNMKALSCVTPGQILSIPVCMINRGKQTVRLDADWQRYTWLALAKVDRQELILTTLEKLLHPEGTEAPLKRTPLDLAPGHSVKSTIRIQAPLAEGLWWVACGYEGEKGKPESDQRNYLAGRIVSVGSVLEVGKKK